MVNVGRFCLPSGERWTWAKSRTSSEPSVHENGQGRISGLSRGCPSGRVAAVAAGQVIAGQHDQLSSLIPVHSVVTCYIKCCLELDRTAIITDIPPYFTDGGTIMKDIS